MKEMKDSGIEWIGNIPSDWKIGKVNQIFVIGRGRVISQLELHQNGKYPVYSSQTKYNGCLGYINTYDFDRNQLTWTTDGANAGTIFLREGKHNCTNVCGTLLPKNDNNNLKYLKYSLEYIAVFHKRADINGYKIMNNEMAKIDIVLPSKDEQDKIANYLDDKCKKIDDIIYKNTLIIESLKEYKNSLIMEIITKGLTKNIELKDSGIEWIGSIPKHWNIEKLKYLGDFNSNGVDKKIYENEKLYKSIHYMDVYKNSLKEISNNENYLMISANAEKAKKCDLLRGDVLFTNSSEIPEDIGHCTVVKGDLDNILFGYHLMRFRFYNEMNLNYTKYLFGNYNTRKWFEYRAIGMTRYGLNLCDFKDLNTIIIPLKEQEQISKYLDEKCNIIDNSMDKRIRTIGKLEEYKKALIFESVTGKIEIKDNMYEASTIALWFIFMNCKNRLETNIMTNMKIQKLLYYAQVYHLIKNSKKLFNEDILAWEHGPVIREVYDQYRKFKDREIIVKDFSDINIDKQTENLLMEVYSKYNGFTAVQLRNLTHKEKPWKNTKRDNVIDIDLIKNFYKDKI